MKVLSATFILLMFHCAACAQKIEQYYDWNWKLTEPATARYYAVIERQDSIWHRQDYFIHERRLQMVDVENSHDANRSGAAG